MAEEPPQISIIDARLAEIDRRLGAIQTGLAIQDPPPEPPPTAEPELPPRVQVDAPPAPPEPAPPPAAPVADLRALAATHERVLEATRELLAAYEQTLASRSSREATVREFSVSAGPFQSTEALRSFERTLAKIPEVREVTVRGYEGEDRAIVDVHLIDPTS
jgi:hypothetical protein